MMVPDVTRMDYQLINIDADNYISLLTDDGETKDDLKLPEGELGEKIRADFDSGKEVLLSVQKAMGTEAIVGSKEAAQ